MRLQLEVFEYDLAALEEAEAAHEEIASAQRAEAEMQAKIAAADAEFGGSGGDVAGAAAEAGPPPTVAEEDPESPAVRLGISRGVATLHREKLLRNSGAPLRIMLRDKDGASAGGDPNRPLDISVHVRVAGVMQVSGFLFWRHRALVSPRRPSG